MGKHDGYHFDRLGGRFVPSSGSALKRINLSAPKGTTPEELEDLAHAALKMIGVDGHHISAIEHIEDGNLVGPYGEVPSSRYSILFRQTLPN